MRETPLKTFECLLHFLFFSQVFRAPTDEAVEQIFVFNTSFDAVPRKVVPFGGYKNLNLKLN